MKTINSILLFLFITNSVYLFSQKNPTKLDKYAWNENPVFHNLPEEEMKDSEIVLKQNTELEFFYDELGGLNQYKLFHNIIKVNSNDAIESNNKIYIPISEGTEVIQEKARVISGTGKVKELDKSDIKESKDEETNKNYRYFAIDGIELGSEIEYYYVLKTTPAYTGNSKYLQSGILKKNVSFTITSPKNLFFVSKSYGGLPDLKADTNEHGQNTLSIFLDSIPGVDEEPFAAYTSNLMRVVYKLDKNSYQNKSNVINYGLVSEVIYDQMYNELSKTELKAAKSILKNINIEKNDSEEQKIRKIENYLKKNFTVIESFMQGLNNLDFIKTNKFCNEAGMVKMFATLFTLIDLEHQLVLTCDRFEDTFDKNFEAYLFLDEYLIYIPSLKVHISPTDVFSRFNYIPSELTYTDALYIIPVELGDFKSGAGKIKFIEPLPSKATYNNMFINADFSDDIQEINISVKTQAHGYYASTTQNIYDYMDDEQEKEMDESLLDFITKEVEVKEVKVENKGTENFGIKPLTTSATFTSSSFIENAGPKFLFKIGEMIGPQQEMYDEKERKFRVENDFNRSYHREITFNIPNGYKIVNLDDLKMDIFHTSNNKRTMAFTSNYEILSDGKIKVVVDEYYNQITYPIEQYEEYRKVINAAADFNKKILFIEKAN